MKRAGFIFKIKKHYKDEYKEAHDNIWPELVKAINDCGIFNYSIFYDEYDGTLFNYLEVKGDFDEAMEKLGNLDIEVEWWKKMDKFFVKSDGSKLGPSVKMLEEVFHME